MKQSVRYVRTKQFAEFETEDDEWIVSVELAEGGGMYVILARYIND